jgi:ketosteroid isomerase-like protein
MSPNGPDPPAEAVGAAASVIAAFNEAFNRQDVAALEGLLTEDCVFDGTTPPDGERHVGRAAVLAAFAAVFAGVASGAFSTEELFSTGDRGVVRWRYDWVDHAGRPGHVRGVDVFRVHDGRIAEKFSYVKG